MSYRLDLHLQVDDIGNLFHEVQSHNNFPRTVQLVIRAVAAVRQDVSFTFRGIGLCVSRLHTAVDVTNEYNELCRQRDRAHNLLDEGMRADVNDRTGDVPQMGTVDFFVWLRDWLHCWQRDHDRGLLATREYIVHELVKRGYKSWSHGIGNIFLSNQEFVAHVLGTITYRLEKRNVTFDDATTHLSFLIEKGPEFCMGGTGL